jgi:hypothetical protein
MFPIPSERELSIIDIALYWSREISPPASAQELRDTISKAWWSGDLIATNSPSRLSVLRHYYSRSAKFIAFIIPNTEEPPQWVADEDGVMEFVRPLRVPVPNANPDTWTVANCESAFDAIAKQWNEALISPSESAPIFLDIVLTSSEFFEWINTIGYTRPTFWSDALEKSGDGRHRWHAKPGNKNKLTQHEEAVLSALNALFPSGELAHKAKQRNTRIKDFLKNSGRGSVETRTIQRALAKITFD